MNGYEASPLIEDIDEDIDVEEIEATEYDEGVEAEFLPFPPFPFPFPGRTRTRPRVAGPGGYYRPPATVNFVTQAQFRDALDKVKRDVSSNAAGIKSVNGKVVTAHALINRHSQELGKQNKINARQSKVIAGVRDEVKKARDMGLIMFLLTRPKATATATESDFKANGAVVPKGNKILYAPEKDNTLMLGLLLSGGLGGSSGDSMSGLLTVLAITGGL